MDDVVPGGGELGQCEQDDGEAAGGAGDQGTEGAVGIGDEMNEELLLVDK